MKCFLLVILNLVSSFLFAQSEKKTNYFGLIISPVIPNSFTNGKITSFSDTSGKVFNTYTQRVGITYGGLARFQLSKNIFLETGLSIVRRSFNTKIQFDALGINRSQRLTYINYDVPINGVFSVQMSEKIYTSAFVGFSIIHYPSDVTDSIIEGNKRAEVQGLRVSRTYFAVNSGIGTEYRTKKAGTFYLGGSIRIPLEPIMVARTLIRESGSGTVYKSLSAVNGSYFTLDFRYFLPYIPQKGKQPLKSVIE